MAAMEFPSPPARTPFLAADGTVSYVWLKWFQALQAQVSVATPAVTGAKSGNAALTSLLSVLTAKGIVTDQST